MLPRPLAQTALWARGADGALSCSPLRQSSQISVFPAKAGTRKRVKRTPLHGFERHLPAKGEVLFTGAISRFRGSNRMGNSGLWGAVMLPPKWSGQRGHFRVLRRGGG